MKSIFSRILGTKVGVQFVYSCGLYMAVYGTQKNFLNETVLFLHPKQILKLMDKKIFTNLLTKFLFIIRRYCYSVDNVMS